MRSRRQLGFAEVRGEVDGRAVLELVPPREQAVRLRHQPDLVQPGPREGGRLLEVLLLRQPGGRRPQGQADREDAFDRGSASYKLGAQVGTTSYSYIVDRIKPSSSPLVYDTNDAAVQALKNGQIDGIVVDLPTAFYVTAVQVPDGVIVGKLPTFGSKERFGMVFQKGNSLRRCVDKALDRLWRNGTIKKLQSAYLARAGAPDLNSTPWTGTGAPGSSAARPAAARASRGRSRSPSSRRSSSSLRSSSSSRGRPAGTPSRRTSSTGTYYRDSFPEILDAFWVNVKLFLTAEVIILPAALLLAVLRSLPGPVFFPIRALAIVYADLFRGASDDPRDLHARVRDARARAPLDPRLAVLLGGRRALARLHRLRLRGVPRRASSRCTPRRRPPPARSASRICSRSATSSSRRPCAA